MTPLAIFNLSLTDVVVILGPMSGAFWLVLKNIETVKEKHKVTEQEATTRHLATIEAEAQKDKRKIDAEVEKERLKQEAEVSKIREQSLSGEAVIKIWKEFRKLEEQYKKLSECQASDQLDKALMKEIMKKIQEEHSLIMEMIFEDLPKRMFIKEKE